MTDKHKSDARFRGLARLNRSGRAGRKPQLGTAERAPVPAGVVVMERRATKRFRVKLPMTVRWRCRRTLREAQTQSENISSRGVYFFLPTGLKKGSSVELVIVMPHEITSAEPLRVRCQGRVRRTEIDRMDRVGVVAEIERYQFLREDENL